MVRGYETEAEQGDMNFVETALRGAFLIDPVLFEDERGYFATSFCRREFEAHGLTPNLAQINISYNKKKGTLRGMHFQKTPHPQAKLVRCTIGAVYDVILDLRPGSPTFMKWTAATLTSQNRRMLYVPDGFAHGFQTVEDCTEVVYNVSDFYAPELADGVRWDDPAFGIQWPAIEERIMIARDLQYPDFHPPT